MCLVMRCIVTNRGTIGKMRNVIFRKDFVIDDVTLKTNFECGGNNVLWR